MKVDPIMSRVDSVLTLAAPGPGGVPIQSRHEIFKLRSGIFGEVMQHPGVVCMLKSKSRNVGTSMVRGSDAFSLDRVLLIECVRMFFYGL